MFQYVHLYGQHSFQPDKDNIKNVLRESQAIIKNYPVFISENTMEVPLKTKNRATI